MNKKKNFPHLLNDDELPVDNIRKLVQKNKMVRLSVLSILILLASGGSLSEARRRNWHQRRHSSSFFESEGEKRVYQRSPQIPGKERFN